MANCREGHSCEGHMYKLIPYYTSFREYIKICSGCQKWDYSIKVPDYIPDEQAAKWAKKLAERENFIIQARASYKI